MEIATCKRCRRIFNYQFGDRICPDCKKIEEDEFKRVKEYLNENPGVKPGAIAEELDISLKVIEKWIREGRLVFVKGTDLGITCERCGKKITVGRLCSECMNNMQQVITAFDKEVETEKAGLGAGMHFKGK